MEITSIQKETIKDKMAELKFTENQRNDLLVKKASAMQQAQKDYDDAVIIINQQHDAKISQIEAGIVTLNTELESVK